MKKLIFIVITVILTSAISHSQSSGPATQSKKTKIVTTLFPLYDMAKFIGSDKANVTIILPPGVEPHSFEPKPSDVVRINEADIFIFTGKFMEPWALDIINGVENKNLIVVDASQGTGMIPASKNDAHKPGNIMDPHIWLDFDNARTMVENIEKALEKEDSSNASFYKGRQKAYTDSLNTLDSLYKATLFNCSSKEIVYGGHFAFGYMANNYDLKYLTAQGISPDAEPSANDLARLVDQIKRDSIKYIFYEELTSPKIAQTIADETNARLLPLNAAHNLTKSQYENGITFFDILRTDLANLKIGLGCH